MSNKFLEYVQAGLLVVVTIGGLIFMFVELALKF